VDERPGCRSLDPPDLARPMRQNRHSPHLPGVHGSACRMKAWTSHTARFDAVVGRTRHRDHVLWETLTSGTAAREPAGIGLTVLGPAALVPWSLRPAQAAGWPTLAVSPSDR
jgi:hypothetical protein